MAAERGLELAIQALLDGRELPEWPPEGDASAGSPADALGIIDAIARAHRIAVLGSDIPPDRPDRTRWGHLEIRGEIGRGASATVYRAWDTRLAREVALKLFAPADVRDGETALEEGRLLARLNHPHIVKVFGADSHDGCAGLWMELLEGDTLEEIVARDGVFSVEETLLIGVDLARAIGAVHAAGLLHRDIKSRNVLRERGGRVVLMDLGAGRVSEPSHAGGDTTGTPMYMAPEVLVGGGATVRSDLYCLGVLLFRLVTARFPVSARDLAALRSAHASSERRALASCRSDVPPDVAAVIERCCDRRPEARYASAVEMETALGDVLTTSLSRDAGVASPLARRWRRWQRPMIVAAAAVLAIVAAGSALWDTSAGRSARRQLELPVPPRSTLYLSMNAALGVVQGLDLSVQPNSTTASPIVVSSDLGVLTMAGSPPWTTGGRFRLDGTPAASLPTVNAGLCCFVDGATDGEFNYAPRQDSTLLEPVGSRPLAPPGLYRFDRDWSNPQLLFPLRPDGYYGGIAYSAVSRTFWLTRKVGSVTVLEEWNRDGRYIRTPVEVPTILVGIAIDPLDDTLWAVRYQQNIAVAIRLENFDRSGRHLGAVEVPKSSMAFGPIGAEFEWIVQR
jgi:serine/threonine protein kinase